MEPIMLQTTVSIGALEAVGLILIYFSPRLLRKVAAWAMARADGVEYENFRRMRHGKRLGVGEPLPRKGSSQALEVISSSVT